MFSQPGRQAIWWLVAALVVIAVVGLASKNKSNNFLNMAAKSEPNSQVVLVTNLGNVEIELLTETAPQTVANFIKLARADFYTGTQFHRVIRNFMIQGGDPLTKTEPDNWDVHGTGGPGYQFADEPSDVKLERGIVAMANSGPHTNGSQFFIIVAPVTDWLQGKHTAFGRVVTGLDIVDKISQVKTNNHDHPLEPVLIEQVILK